MNYNNFADMEYLKKIYMLQLSEKDNQGGRNLDSVKKHVSWLREKFFKEKKSLKILDLGCGIGHYTRELAMLGHACTGIDISSYAIDYAKTITPADIHCNYICADLLTYDFDGNYDVIVFPYSVFNIFDKQKSLMLLRKIFGALKNNGLFYFEVINFEKPSCDHECLAGPGGILDNFYSKLGEIILLNRKWIKSSKKIIDQYFVINKNDYSVSEHKGEVYVYTQKNIERLLLKSGFEHVRFYDVPPGASQDVDLKYFFISAKK